MAAELLFAIRQTDRSDLAFLGVAVVGDWGGAVTRRAKGLFDLASSLAKGAVKEVQGGIEASERSGLPEHLLGRGKCAWQASEAFVSRMARTAGDLILELREDPSEAGPRLLTLVLAALASGGGVDGDGGAPDLDIPLFGIGAHRSPFTHSILMGATLETAIYALTRLVVCVHKNLPAQHDPVFDKFLAGAAPLVDAAARGASVGIAYHLLVDGLAQPAAYHGLPFPMPMMAHQTILAMNGVAEGADVPHKPAMPGVESDLHRRAETASEASEFRKPSSPAHKFAENSPERANFASDRLAFGEPTSRAISEHERLAKMTWKVPRGLREWLSSDEIQILERHRHKMVALDRGTIPPISKQHARFVLVARGELVASTELEHAWVALREATVIYNAAVKLSRQS
ncbi:MAG: DUF413 domain-containing protein [Burkholderiales bacterium]|nr:DUF413 domain-containing protein [Burkholderiales bacterium]